MFSTGIAWLAKFISSTKQTFMRGVGNALEPTSRTIPTYLDLFTLLFCILSLLSVELVEKLRRKLGTTHRAIY